MKPKRKKIPPQTKETLLKLSAGVCCVCKSRGLGVNFHHIDENPSNNILDNIAVLCVKDHDAHHRPNAYSVNHRELGAEKIKAYKVEWESFVLETQKENPQALAIVNVYGTHDNVVGMRLLFQTVESKIVLQRMFNHLESSWEKWIDSTIEDILWLNSKIPLIYINEPLAIEYSEKGDSLANVLDSNVARKILSPDWEEKSVCTIFINPNQPSLALLVNYKSEVIFTAILQKHGSYLYLECDNFDREIHIKKKPSVRTQVTQIVSKLLDEWQPGQIFVGTGNSDDPDIIDDLNLPKLWEAKWLKS
jgi:hypothetical protein